MKLNIMRQWSISNYWIKCSKCGSQYRQYCSKSDEFSREKSDPTGTRKAPAGVSSSDAAATERFKYPEPRIKASDYVKPLSEYFIEDMKSSISLLNPYRERKIEDRNEFPYVVEFIILGAGPIGTCIAFWLAKYCNGSIPILVVDKDISIKRTSDSAEAIKISLQSSTYTLKQEYELKEHVQLSQFAAEFLRNMDFHSGSSIEFPDIPFQPFGTLTLSYEKNSELLKKVHADSLFANANNELLTPYQLNQRFPWLNTDDISLAMHGLKDEGWFDPDTFLMKIRSLASNFKVKFLEAETLEFVYSPVPLEHFPGFDFEEYQPCNHVYLKLNTGDIRKVQFAVCIMALGADAGSFCKEMLHLDKRYNRMHGFEVPIVPRKRHVFSVTCPDGGPGISSPLIIDPSGLFIRRCGALNEYICGCPPPLHDESSKDLSANEFFERIVWPLLAARIPAFENLRLNDATTYFEDFNTFDGSPIVGFHPAYHNLYLATGFGDRCYQHAPGIGRSVADLMFHGDYKSIDLRPFTFHRIAQELPLLDSCVI